MNKIVMKELSIEEKARAYDTALEGIQEILNSGQDSIKISRLRLHLQGIFPELKESEDEQMRKALIEGMLDMVKDYGWSDFGGIPTVDVLDWLEKQGKQKPTNNTDKIEPKFRVGEWIIRSAEGFKHNTYLVKEIKDYYVCEELKGRRVTFTFSDVHKNFKLWNIADAKNGDVLAAHECIVLFKEIDGLNIKCYCTYHYMGFNPSFHVDTLQNKNAFHPATKEQRDTLFAKMKEAGYEWDDEKKLKKIEQTPDNSITSVRKKIIDIIKERVFNLTLKYIDNYCDDHPVRMKENQEENKEILDEIIMRKQDYDSIMYDDNDLNLNYEYY